MPEESNSDGKPQSEQPKPSSQVDPNMPVTLRPTMIKMSEPDGTEKAIERAIVDHKPSPEGESGSEGKK